MGRTWIAIAIALLSVSRDARAITLGFAPSSSSVSVGSPVSVSLVASDLTDAAAPSLGTFDLNVVFDSALLGLTGVSFGDPVLGDQLDLFGAGSISGSDGSVPGVLNVFQISFDAAEDLDDLQAGSFTLITLTFETLAAGTSSLDLTAVTLGDALGDPLIADLVPGSITALALPEPALAALAALAGVFLILARSRPS
ncbi:MAG: cohesin domain-containing protein [Myxococcota bacterium]